MAVDTAGQARTPLDLKSAQLSVVAMVLKTVDVAAVAAELAARSADDPEFFDNDPVLIDLSAVQAEEQPIDFAALVQLLAEWMDSPAAAELSVCFSPGAAGWPPRHAAAPLRP